VPDSEQSEASFRTVLVAVTVNLAIAIAKAVAAALTGSAALWAETLHSFADTGNEVLLFVGVRRSDRPADGRHPFGYGQERFFWSFLAALGIFVVGGVLSILEGVRSFLDPEPLTSLVVGVAVLVVSIVLEAISWRTARNQLRAEAQARNRSMAEHLRLASDPTAVTVFLEDTAAIVGLLLALAAIGLHAWTGSAVWDAGASVLIGVLLIGVAFLVARRSKGLLIDQSAPDDVLDRLRDRIGGEDWVAEIVVLTAVYVGPGSLLVAAHLRPTVDRAAGPAEQLIGCSYRLRDSLCGEGVIEAAEITLVPAVERVGPARSSSWDL
jgi:cation diffusion facilitator family transporter